jgi:hypothetical protein
MHRGSISIDKFDCFLYSFVKSGHINGRDMHKQLCYEDPTSMSLQQDSSFVCATRGESAAPSRCKYTYPSGAVRYGSNVVYFEENSSRTSTVSSTLITPGWRSVRSLRRALRARERRLLFALTSKEKILHLELSSLYGVNDCHDVRGSLTYSLRSVMKRPDRIVYINPIAKRIREWRAFGDCRRNG